jgi:hypothetical protein
MKIMLRMKFKRELAGGATENNIQIFRGRE